MSIGVIFKRNFSGFSIAFVSGIGSVTVVLVSTVTSILGLLIANVDLHSSGAISDIHERVLFAAFVTFFLSSAVMWKYALDRSLQRWEECVLAEKAFLIVSLLLGALFYGYILYYAAHCRPKLS